MAIEYWIDEAPQTGLETQSIWVLLLDTSTYEVRRFETAFVPIGEDPDDYIDANFTPAQMWAAGTAVNEILDSLRERQLLKALIKLMVNEINILRAIHSLPERTMQQAKNALKAELGEE